MKNYLNEILKNADEIHKNAFDTKELYKRFERLDTDDKISVNKCIKEELFSDVLWKNCFVDDVFKILYCIFDEVEKNKL